MSAASRESEILAAGASQPRPAAVMCVNLHNFKAYNAVRSAEHGDRLLVLVETRLRELGRTWREQCAGCGAAYERTDLISVLGEETGSAYM